jgi:hypothetical protein
VDPFPLLNAIVDLPKGSFNTGGEEGGGGGRRRRRRA